MTTKKNGLPIKMPAAALQAIEDAATEIGVFCDEAEAAFGEKTEQWQESDRGLAFEAWYESWRDFAEGLSEAPDQIFGD